VEQNYQRVPTVNRDHELLQEAMRREVAVNPAAEPTIRRIRSVADQLRGGQPGSPALAVGMPTASSLALGWTD